jgi:hypothetical protein
MIEEDEMIGQWTVEIPDIAKILWTELDIRAFDLTFEELFNCGDVATFHDLHGNTTMYRGDFIESNRRRVGEALAHLIALAQVNV